MSMKEDELQRQVHMKMLAKSGSSKEFGELTVIPLGHAVSVAMQLITERDAEREAPEPTWWVTDHSTTTIRKVSGPFSTDADAARARQILEKFEDHHNYWLEQEEAIKRKEEV